ncbi:DNA-binding protein P3A2 [Anabrus simplex]|uniref:DNA-binding protein P3A2 n=1 Tax=Anabrus simplex TaxID=316456 RepID=UPI0034DD7CB0
MAAAPCLSSVTEEGTMISNLPLLFADGFPACLETITEEQLEKFVPFMISCSKGHTVGSSNSIPKWWPSDVPFMLPLIRPQGLETKWIALLKSLVCRCYTYHGCEFMLRFCTELAKYPKTRLKFHNDWAGTTSLYDKETGKLLVTIRDENRFYDKKKETPRKSLLPRVNPMISPSKVRVSPLFPDIYLCDNCDAEFKTLDEVKTSSTSKLDTADLQPRISTALHVSIQPNSTENDVSP